MECHLLKSKSFWRVEPRRNGINENCGRTHRWSRCSQLSYPCVGQWRGSWRPSGPAHHRSPGVGFYLAGKELLFSWKSCLKWVKSTCLETQRRCWPLLWACGQGYCMQLQNSLGRVSERITNSVKITKYCGIWCALRFCIPGLGTCFLPLANAL